MQQYSAEKISQNGQRYHTDSRDYYFTVILYFAQSFVAVFLTFVCRNYYGCVQLGGVVGLTRPCYAGLNVTQLP